MARIKGAMMTRKRRNKVLKLAKGYYGSKHSLFKTAKQAVMKSGNYAYIGRKQKKRDFRRLLGVWEGADLMPLGAGAIAGTTFPIDRHMVAEELNFNT